MLTVVTSDIQVVDRGIFAVPCVSVGTCFPSLVLLCFQPVMCPHFRGKRLWYFVILNWLPAPSADLLEVHQSLQL